MIRLELPYPPTINHYYGRARNGRLYIKKRGREYRECVWMRVRASTNKIDVSLLPLTGRLSVTLQIFPPDRRKRDIDNVQKALLDALEKAGVYKNDNQIKDLHSRMHIYDPTEGLRGVIVTVREYLVEPWTEGS